jgi:hypothetical protein
MTPQQIDAWITRARKVYFETLVEAVQTAMGFASELADRCADCQAGGTIEGAYPGPTCPACTRIGEELPALQEAINKARTVYNAAVLMGHAPEGNS